MCLLAELLQYNFGMLKFHMSAFRPCTKTRLPYHGKTKICFLKRIPETNKQKNPNTTVILDEYHRIVTSEMNF